jgi:hypothetical protein
MGTKEHKSWVGKKEPTNPSKKEQHLDRKTKREIQRHVIIDDWVRQLRDYYATQQIQD